jgi:hypothetical protein
MIDALARQYQLVCTEWTGVTTQQLAIAKKGGDILTNVKKQLGHGEWLHWVEENATVTRRTLAKWMRVAKEWPAIQEAARAKGKTTSHLGLDEALELIATPKAAADRRAHPAPARGEEQQAVPGPESATPAQEAPAHPVRTASANGTSTPLSASPTTVDVAVEPAPTPAPTAVLAAGANGAEVVTPEAVLLRLSGALRRLSDDAARCQGWPAVAGICDRVRLLLTQIEQRRWDRV